MIPNPLFNIWEHSQTVVQLYTRRAEGFEEMDAAAQGAELLRPYIEAASKTPRLLDVGCGSGYFYHSFKKRSLNIDYYGLDYSPSLVAMGQRILPTHGLPAGHLICQTIEDLQAQPFDLVALLNTLTFCPDFREPLDHLLACQPQVLLIRDNFGPETIIRWEIDGYLDDGFNHLKAYWNQWSVGEVSDFIGSYGYELWEIKDLRSGGQKELVVDKPYYWSWILAEKRF